MPRRLSTHQESAAGIDGKNALIIIATEVGKSTHMTDTGIVDHHAWISVAPQADVE